MISTNKLQPKVYAVTKIMEDKPKGLILLTFKQDEYDEKRDNTDLFCCNYYDDNGEEKTPTTPTTSEPLDTDKCELYQCIIDDDGETVRNDNVEPLHLGQTSYFACEYGSDNYKSTWTVTCIDDIDDDTKEYFENIVKLTIFDDNNVSIKVSRVNSVIGHKFRLTVINNNNANETASLELEVEK